jgi:hypothetical protein
MIRRRIERLEKAIAPYHPDRLAGHGGGCRCYRQRIGRCAMIFQSSGRLEMTPSHCPDCGRALDLKDLETYAKIILLPEDRKPV